MLTSTIKLDQKVSILTLNDLVQLFKHHSCMKFKKPIDRELVARWRVRQRLTLDHMTMFRGMPTLDALPQ